MIKHTLVGIIDCTPNTTNADIIKIADELVGRINSAYMTLTVKLPFAELPVGVQYNAGKVIVTHLETYGEPEKRQLQITLEVDNYKHPQVYEPLNIAQYFWVSKKLPFLYDIVFEYHIMEVCIDEIKTSNEWCNQYNLHSVIKDFDGWDRLNFEWSFYDELITLVEFKNRVLKSTCRMTDECKQFLDLRC